MIPAVTPYPILNLAIAVFVAGFCWILGCAAAGWLVSRAKRQPAA